MATSNPSIASQGRQLTLRLLLTIVLWSALSTLFLHRYVFAVYVIEGSSMAPTLNDGDMALVNMLARQIGPLERGEIVLVRDGFRDYATKRIIGLPGETITLKENRVYINGLTLKEGYLPKNTVTSSAREDFILGPNEYFVLGDNREDSYDSRLYGPVPKEAIRGSYSKTFWACR